VSEPLRTCRKRIGDVETGEKSLPWEESGRWPDCCPDGIRHEGGVTLRLALARNVGTCRPMPRKTLKWEAPMRARVPMRGTGTEQLAVGLKAL
jgi:hypothetical protein